jgi:TonB family protein
MLCTNCGNVLESFNKFCPKCGAPAPAQYQPPSPGMGASPYVSPQSPMMGGPPPRKSSCGKVILIIAIVLVLLGLAVAGAVYYGYRAAEKALKSTEAYATALSALKENSEVREKLGEITDTGFPLGALSQNADGSGDAAFTMSVHGTKSTGQYKVELRRRNGVWKVRSGTVRLENGDAIRFGETTETETVPGNLNTNTGISSPENSGTGKTISGGVLNGKANSLPEPAYPPVAKAAHASGNVVVQVTIDEQGNVISARAVSGHPLLRAAAESAARQAKFSPTKLSGKPVKVSGVITYNFVSE